MLLRSVFARVRWRNEEPATAQRDLAVVGKRGFEVTPIQKANKPIAPVLARPLAIHDQPHICHPADFVLQHGSELRLCRGVGDGLDTPWNLDVDLHYSGHFSRCAACILGYDGRAANRYGHRGKRVRERNLCRLAIYARWRSLPFPGTAANRFWTVPQKKGASSGTPLSVRNMEWARRISSNHRRCNRPRSFDRLATLDGARSYRPAASTFRTLNGCHSPPFLATIPSALSSAASVP